MVREAQEEAIDGHDEKQQGNGQTNEHQSKRRTKPGVVLAVVVNSAFVNRTVVFV